jgi:hypothetical protein
MVRYPKFDSIFALVLLANLFRAAAPHEYLLFRVLAYRIQVNVL